MSVTTETGPAAEAGPELVIERLYDAPRELVWRAWTRPEMAARWFGPKGFVTERYELDARPGGRYRHTMRSPEGTVHTKQGVFHDVTAPSRLVFTFAWEDEAGRPKHEMLVTVTFEALGERTRLTLRQTRFESVNARDLHRGGWSSSLDRFADYLAEQLDEESAREGHA